MEFANFGLYLYQKERKDLLVLKDLLQLLKTNSPSKNLSFSYIEAENSLLPDLSLWENIQIVSGSSSWKEFCLSAKPEVQSLTKFISSPEKKSNKAEHWEKFIVSLIKGAHQSNNLLIDLNEDHLSSLLVQQLKRVILNLAPEKQIYLASANTGLWIDCAHTLVERKQYEFCQQKLNSHLLKKHWAA
jgi:hypothetical protein